ncbi:hypothetical protein ACHAWF_016869 [Thalassiosira exigua]
MVNETTDELLLESIGHCRVYRFQARSWELERSITGKVSEERLGSSAAVSPDGNIVACGGVGGTNGSSESPSGVVRLWNRADSQESVIWSRGGGPAVEGAAFGTSVALSGSGEYVGIGVRSVLPRSISCQLSTFY